MGDIKFIHKDAQVDIDEAKKVAGGISHYIEHLFDVSVGADKKKIEYKEAESLINLPFDIEMQKSVNEVAERVRTKFLKYIIIVGSKAFGGDY